MNTVRRVRDAAFEWILSDNSIRIDQTPQGMRARIRPHLHWRAAFAMLFPFFPLLLAWHLLRHQPAIPYIGRYIPHAASQLIDGVAAVLIASFSVVLAITMLDRILTRGTIQANPDRLLVSLRGIWRHALELAAADVGDVCAAPDETRSEDRYGGQWQPGLMLRITPVQGKPMEILNWRHSGNVTTLATAINHGLGVSREQRRRAWLAQQIENAAAPPSTGMLSYGAQIEGVALDVSADRVVISLPPRGLLASIATFTVTSQSLSVTGTGMAPQEFKCDDIHSIEPLDQTLGFGPLAIVRENGMVTTLFKARPIPELRYAATVLRGALGLSNGFGVR